MMNKTFFSAMIAAGMMSFGIGCASVGANDDTAAAVAKTTQAVSVAKKSCKKSCKGGECSKKAVQEKSCKGGECSKKAVQEKSCKGGECSKKAVQKKSCKGGECSKKAAKSVQAVKK